MQTTGVKGARLSLQQERLWALQGQSRVYRAQCAVIVEGRLDAAAWQQAWQQMVAQHEILQTLFYTLPGMEVPVQVIGRCPQLCCPLVDLQDMVAPLQDSLLATLFRQRQEEAFDLERGPLLCLVLVRLAVQRHVLLVNLPALCADAATLPRLLGGVCRRYEACLQGSVLDEEPLQYNAIAAWQQKLLGAESAKPPQAFWSKVDLSGLAQLPMPFERREQGAQRGSATGGPRDFAPQHLSQVLEESLTERLHALAQHSEVSLEAVLLTGWYLCLWRLSAERHLLIGVVADGRLYEELADVLGLYSRVVPLSLSSRPTWPLLQLLIAVNRSWQEAMKWQSYFTGVVEGPAGAEGSGTVAFPLSFEYERWPASWRSGPLTLWLMQRASCSAPFALKLTALHHGSQLHLEVHYDPERLRAEQARRLVVVLHRLLEGMVEQPQSAIDSLPLLSVGEQEQLLRRFRAPRRSLTAQGLHELFEAQAAQRGGQMAVVDAREQLSYHQLNERVNQLAWVLRRRGVGPNVLVGLCVGRSVHMLVGLLAILKAGGAYVPLEPTQPAARLGAQLAALQAPLLLTQQAVGARVPEWGGQTLWWEQLGEELEQAPRGNLPDLSQGQDLAYVIYTSGSTGVPKGVMIRRQSVVNYSEAMCQQLGVEPGWHFATVSTLAADLGNTSIFCGLASGGCVQVLDYETITSGEALARWVSQHPIDVLKIVPSHLVALLDTQEQGRDLLPRRALVLGGEALASSLLERLRELGGSCRVYNHYGPTETTIGVLVNAMGGLQERLGQGVEEEERPVTVPLGQPLANTQIYVLDERQQVVPVGVTGELYVGGEGVALGYLGQGEQTAERFVPNGCGGAAGERLYRTGDLVRTTGGGQIEFMGRRDRQVKVRGYRIELGEIEVVLRRHPDIRNAVVEQREGAGGGQLVGYVVPRQQPGPSRGELQKFVREQLPDYMVPSGFVYLKDLPLTANGKVDRRQLITAEVNGDDPISPVIDSGSKAKTVIQPRDAVEFQLLQIWEEILQVQPISVLDNFFDLGGHSILAVRLMSHILKQFGQDLALATLFLHPTIASLSVVLRQEIKFEAHSALIALQSRGSNLPFFCVSPSGGTVFCYVNLARHLGTDQPFYGLTPDFNTSGDTPGTIKDMAAHYITAIQAVQPRGPYLLGGWSAGGIVAFEMAQQLRRQEHEIALLAIIDSVLTDSDGRARAAEEKIDLGDKEVARNLVDHFEITVPDDFYERDVEAQLSYALDQAKQRNGVPVDADLEQVRRIIRTTNMTMRIVHMYVPQSYQGRIDYFVSSDSISHTTSANGLEDSAETSVKRDYLSPWREFASGGIEIHRVPGGHREMVEEPHVQVLAASLKHCIARACNQSS